MAMSPASSHIAGRQALAAAWVRVTGREATLPELQIAGAQAHLESGYGRATYLNKLTGERRALNNWGAVRSGNVPCGENGFEATDTHADGTEYQQCYRIYPTSEDGAMDFVKHMTIERPTSWEHMKRGDIDAWAIQMHSWKLDANGNRTNERNRDPQTGTYGYFEQTPVAGKSSRAYGVEIRIAEIAAALGEEIAAKRGGPVSGGDDGGPLSNPWFHGIGIALLIAVGAGGLAALAGPKAIALIRTVL